MTESAGGILRVMLRCQQYKAWTYNRPPWYLSFGPHEDVNDRRICVRVSDRWTWRTLVCPCWDWHWHWSYTTTNRLSQELEHKKETVPVLFTVLTWIRLGTRYRDHVQIGVCYFVLLNRYWGIVTVPGFLHERVKGYAPTIENRRRTTSPCPPLDNLGLPDPHPSP